MTELDETRALISRTREGDRGALDELFARHRPRLLRMAQVRLDARLRGRVDAGDVIQEVHLEAFTRLDTYLAEESPMPFFLWMRYLTSQKLMELQRRHLGAQRRDVRQEVRFARAPRPNATCEAMVEHLLGANTAPSQAAVRSEDRERLHAALESMDAMDREVLVLRHFEQLSNVEVAAELDLTTAAASKRHVRAAKRLKDVLATLPGYTESEFRS